MALGTQGKRLAHLKVLLRWTWQPVYSLCRTLKSGLLLLLLLVQLSSHPEMPPGLAQIMALSLLHGPSPWIPACFWSVFIPHSLYAMPTQMAVHSSEGSDQCSYRRVCMHYSTPPAEGDLDFSVPGFDCFGQRDIRHVVSGVLNVIVWVGLALELLW